jgi:hypothetical protein
MSTFDGVIREFEPFKIRVLVDNFSKLRDKSYREFAFLSHCHIDHMNGIDSYPRDIYMTKESNAYLAIEHPKVWPKILPLDTPTIIDETDNYKLSATLIDANHCKGLRSTFILGSCSFIFRLETESDDIVVLYTGDTRLEESHAEYSDALRSTRHLYIVSTYDVMHSSLSELQDFISRLNPVSIYPCVLDRSVNGADIKKLLSASLVTDSQCSKGDDTASLASTVPLERDPSPILLDESEMEELEGEELDGVAEEKIWVDISKGRLPRRENVDKWVGRWLDSTVCPTSFVPLV